MHKLVMGSGPIDAPIVMVGEAPGVEEERFGKPFIGTSGELLTRLMHQVGIAREGCYITNVVKERPPQNKIEHFIRFDKKGVIVTDAYKRYESFLMEELSTTNANVYVAVGGVSLYALTRLDKVTKRRGSILTGYVDGKQIKVIPIIHPASALRNYPFTHFIRFDLKRVLEESAYPEVRLPGRRLSVGPNFLESIAYLNSCHDLPLLGFDIEVVNEEVSCISVAKNPYDVISIPFYAEGRDHFTVDQEIAVWKELTSLLENPNIVKVGHNIAFDSTFLFIKYGIRTTNMKDTMILSSICYPDFPKGLDFVTSICTKEPYYKDDGKKWFRFGGSIHDFWLYNAKDSAVCIESLPVLEAEAQRQGNEATVERQTSILPSLVYMQGRGIKVDKVGMDKAAKEYEWRIGELQEELNKTAGQVLNANSSKQLIAYFYGTKGIKPYMNRATGNVSVDAMALKRMSKKGIKEAQLILEMRHLIKIKSTYFEMELDDDNRIRCSFNPVGTENGRLSSSKTIFGKGGNMQNLPPEMLRFLVADPGCFLYNIDLSQAENRIVAYISPEPNMISAFEQKIDIHRKTAGLIFGKPWEEISDEKGSASIGGGLRSERDWGKSANHGLNYDLSYRAAALIWEVPDNEAKYIVDRYHAVYPGVRQMHAWVRAQLNKNRTLTNCLGRRRLFTGRWGDELFKEAYAFIPQSTVADIINERGLAFVMNNPMMRGVEILNQVHDSLVIQISYETVPVEQHAACLKAIVNSLQTPLTFRGQTFSIPADTAVGLTLNKKSLKGVPVNGHSTNELTNVLASIHERVIAESKTKDAHFLADIDMDNEQEA